MEHVAKILSVLTETGFVEQRISITESEPSRTGRYHITNPYLRFYFRFLIKSMRGIAANALEAVVGSA
jgi:AAA+ ATPase superfamily predicted ATPase